MGDGTVLGRDRPHFGNLRQLVQQGGVVNDHRHPLVFRRDMADRDPGALKLLGATGVEMAGVDVEHHPTADRDDARIGDSRGEGYTLSSHLLLKAQQVDIDLRRLWNLRISFDLGVPRLDGVGNHGHY